MKKSKEERREAFHKLVKCVLSCKTIEHIESCYKMIKFYENLFSDHILEIKSEVEVLKEELQKIEKDIN